MANSVLVIEDNRDIAHLIALHLKDMGIQVDQKYDGDTGLSKALSKSYDLIILDLMLPGVDGLEICRKLRTGNNYVPILMLTAKSTEFDRVLGLEMGADDYLVKPFSLKELVARVKAIFRRVNALSHNKDANGRKQLNFNDLAIDRVRRSVSIDGKAIELTAKEFDLLWQFAQHPGRVYTRNQLLDQVWGYGHEGYEHTVNSHINRLRAKIESDPSRPIFIVTVWGVGYKFSGSDDQPVNK